MNDSLHFIHYLARLDTQSKQFLHFRTLDCTHSNHSIPNSGSTARERISSMIDAILQNFEKKLNTSVSTQNGSTRYEGVVDCMSSTTEIRAVVEEGVEETTIEPE